MAGVTRDTARDPGADDSTGGTVTGVSDKELKRLQHLLFIYRVAFYGTMAVLALTILTTWATLNMTTILEAVGLLDYATAWFHGR